MSYISLSIKSNILVNQFNNIQNKIGMLVQVVHGTNDTCNSEIPNKLGLPTSYQRRHQPLNEYRVNKLLLRITLCWQIYLDFNYYITMYNVYKLQGHHIKLKSTYFHGFQNHIYINFVKYNPLMYFDFNPKHTKNTSNITFF